MPEKISIICNDMKSHGPGGNFTVIHDGRIEEELTWDEMLGQVASLTLMGKPRFNGHSLGEDSCWWRRTKLLAPIKDGYSF